MNNWPTKKLGEVCEKIKIEKAPVGANPYVEIGDVNIETKNINFKKKGAVKGSIFAPPNCIIVSRVRPTRGAAALLEDQTIISSAFTILKPKPIIDLRFLFLCTAKNPKFFNYLGTKQKGSNYPSCKEADILDFEIPLPPLEMQKKIVAKVESLLAKVSEAKKLRAEAQESASNLLSAEIHKVFEEGKKKGWEEKNIGDPSIMKMTSGGTPRKSHPEYYGEEIKWLKSGELEDNENITSSEDHITQEGLKKSSAKLFPPQTVLLAMYGATAGKLGILGVEASTNQAVAGMICKPEKLHHKFLFYSLMRIRDEIIANAWGGAQPNLSQTIIKRFSVVLPSISEQKKNRRPSRFNCSKSSRS